MRTHDVQFPSEKNAFLFSRGKNSARSRRAARSLIAHRGADPAAAARKIFLQKG
jgi:hypothetical protein